MVKVPIKRLLLFILYSLYKNMLNNIKIKVIKNLNNFFFILNFFSSLFVFFTNLTSLNLKNSLQRRTSCNGANKRVSFGEDLQKGSQGLLAYTQGYERRPQPDKKFIPGCFLVFSDFLKLLFHDFIFVVKCTSFMYNQSHDVFLV